MSRRLRSILAGWPPARALRRALRSARSWYGELGSPLPAERDPLDPWRSYRFIDTARHRDKLRSGSQYRPLTLQCETVNICNNLCIICSYPHDERQKSTMPMELFEKVLRDYADMGGGYLSLTPIGGDVLLDKYLLERLRVVRRYPAIREIGVTTNAAMLDRFTDQDVDAIANGFDKLQVSIYGLDEEEYFAMTKRKTYPRVIDGIRRILRARSKETFLAFRLLKPRSRQEIDAWVLENFGHVTSVSINSIMTGGYANFSVLDTAEPLPFGATWSETEQKKTQCLLPLLAMQVSSNGTVAFCPCVGALDGLTLGNIKEHTLLELYNTPKARELWNWAEFGVPVSCARCSFYTPLDAVRDDPSILRDPSKRAGA